MSTTLAAHRGYKAEYPENTIRAFQTAVEAGCDVIETDLHISADDHIIIAHDIDTSRVFGESYDVTKTNYVGTLDQLLTLREPRSKMPLFRDVLLWCIETNEQHKDRNIKLMLDIKGDNDPVQLYNLMWELLHDLKGIDFWKNKLIFGLWSPQFYIPEKLNGFKVINISFDFHNAKAFYEKVVDLHSGATIHGISMIKFILYREKDLNDMMDWLHENNLKLWLWTINNNLELKQAIEKTVKNKEILLDGIVTDDPIKVYERFPENKISWNYNFKLWLQNSLFGILLFLYRRNFNLKPAFNMLKRLGLI